MWTLNGPGGPYSSSVAPFYDVAFCVWRCKDASGAAFNVVDQTGNAFSVSPPQPKVQMQFTPPEFESKMFELAELAAIRASTDAGVVQALRIMDDPRLSIVDLTTISTQRLIGYLESLGLLTAQRAAQILAGTPAS